MPEYIIVDSNGDELRREPKSKGRTRSGAISLDDGNWVIVDANAVVAVPEAIEPITSVELAGSVEEVATTEDVLVGVENVVGTVEVETENVNSVADQVEEQPQVQVPTASTFKPKPKAPSAPTSSTVVRPDMPVYKMKVSKQISLKKLLKSVHVSTGAVTSFEDVVTITRPDVLIEDMGVPEWGCRYRSYAKFEINRRTGDLSIWNIRSTGQPDLMYLAVITDVADITL